METILPRKPVRRGQQMEMETTCQGFSGPTWRRFSSGLEEAPMLDDGRKMSLAFTPYYRINIRPAAFGHSGRNKPLFSLSIMISDDTIRRPRVFPFLPLLFFPQMSQHH
jgi:hypothetical protein